MSVMDRIRKLSDHNAIEMGQHFRGVGSAYDDGTSGSVLRLGAKPRTPAPAPNISERPSLG